MSTWEGNPQQTFSSILSGYNIENVEIIGKVLLKGNANFDNWWNDCKVKNTAWRPKSIFFNNCKSITVHGLEIYDSPSWSVHPFYCENMKFLDLYINNPKVSPNTDGINPESCKELEINGCRFNLGDDCIAIKSGKIYMANEYYQPTIGVKIVNCKMEHGHGAIVFGSEIACGVKDLYVANCYFNETDRGFRVKTRRGRGEKSIIDNIMFQNIIMDKVKTPITLNSYYNCDPDGNSDYVASKEAIGNKSDIPTLGSFYFDNLQCNDLSHAVCVAYGLPENFIEKIVITNSKFNFSKVKETGEPLMMREALNIEQELINLLNVKSFELDGNKFSNIKSSNTTLVNINEMKESNNEYS
ncbi:MAG: glycoside hydrolase family 28 protein [Coprobacillaceae bacterium]